MHVSTDRVCLIAQPPSLQADVQRATGDESAHRAAFRQVTVSQFDSWLRHVIKRINPVRPDSSHCFYRDIVQNYIILSQRQLNKCLQWPRVPFSLQGDRKVMEFS